VLSTRHVHERPEPQLILFAARHEDAQAGVVERDVLDVEAWRRTCASAIGRWSV
jgi:hypothetical protein